MTKRADTEKTPNPALSAWPLSPEDMLAWAPEDLTGSPYDMLTCALDRAQAIVGVLETGFLSQGQYRPSDEETADVLGAAKGHLRLVGELLEKLELCEDDAEVAHE